MHYNFINYNALTFLSMWSKNRYYIIPSDFKTTVSLVYSQVFRSDFNNPGFSLIDFGKKFNSNSLREYMVELKSELSEILKKKSNKKLNYLSMGRFNQQTTTKHHLDGAPDESFLMLGYEPTVVKSKLFLSDYAKLAYDLCITPRTYLDEHNPMFKEGEEMLLKYTTEVDGFNNEHFQIVLINNSSLNFNEQNLLGVLHKAIIINPQPDKDRIINSTMIFSVHLDEIEEFDQNKQEAFINTDLISRQAKY
jgi:hypothetical protein